MPQALITILILLLSTSVRGQSFWFELFARESSGVRLIKEGTLQSSANETTVTRWPRDPKVLDKQLSLKSGFVVGLGDHAESRLTGIGLWVKRLPSPMEASQYPGFSWEWFDLSTGNTFQKRKGDGSIRITTRSIGERVLVERVEFLDDITFELNAKEDGAPGTYTHELRIKKGSVLAFSPEPK